MHSHDNLDLIGTLTQRLRRLPGVGPKSAQRMAYHLLERDRDGGRELGAALVAAMDGIGHCDTCGTLSEHATCRLCSSTRRDRRQLCVVESPADVAALEAGTDFDGLYFVLMGRLSPLDGIGPDELGLDRLETRFKAAEVREVILATSVTVEGDATAYYIAELARENGVNASRIAHGVPVGGELEYVDGGTLSHALHGRTRLE
jgi:recombination protein RecR